MDRISIEARSANMSKIRGKDTVPELLLRRQMFRLGFRYRLHRKDLPGTPDIIFVKEKIAVFVHGCFWHSHQNCRFATVPKTRQEFWLEKFTKNMERDKISQMKLTSLGWLPVVVWGCELSSEKKIANVSKKLATLINQKRLRLNPTGK